MNHFCQVGRPPPIFNVSTRGWLRPGSHGGRGRWGALFDGGVPHQRSFQGALNREGHRSNRNGTRVSVHYHFFMGWGATKWGRGKTHSRVSHGPKFQLEFRFRWLDRSFLWLLPKTFLVEGSVRRWLEVWFPVAERLRFWDNSDEIFCWLVVWNINSIFPYIGNVIIPID